MLDITLSEISVLKASNSFKDDSVEDEKTSGHSESTNNTSFMNAVLEAPDFMLSDSKKFFTCDVFILRLNVFGDSRRAVSLKLSSLSTAGETIRKRPF